MFLYSAFEIKFDPAVNRVLISTQGHHLNNLTGQKINVTYQDEGYRFLVSERRFLKRVLPYMGVAVIFVVWLEPHPKEYPYCILGKLDFIFLIRICLNISIDIVQYEGEWWEGQISFFTMW